MPSFPSPPSGRVYLVGAGPGDPSLITLRGIQCLQRAEFVLYDYLVNPVIVQHAPAGADLICLGRHGGQARIWSQDEINQRLLELAREGRTVVRLKGGDPAVFARGGEEAEFLARHGVPLEIVPGITAALAAGSHAGIPITHRQLASAVALVTGQEETDKPTGGLDFAALARFPGTLVFYMGVTTAPKWTTELMQHGLPGQTPVAIVRRCSLPDQQTIRCRLDQVAELLTPYHRLPPPVIVIVGAVAGQEVAIDWFERRPLFGRTVLVTRSRAQAAELAEPLIELGAQVLYQPAIRIDAPSDWHAVDESLKNLSRYDWLVFSSVNGVRYFFDRLWAQQCDLRAVAGLSLATIGPATADALAEYHLRADVQPDEFRAERLAERLARDAQGARFLLVRASRGRELLAERLQAAGGSVDEVVVYQSTDVEVADPEVDAALESGTIDWITVTSSAIARSLVAMFGERLRRARLVSISPVTSATLLDLGFSPQAEAAVYTMGGMVAAIGRHSVD